MTKELPRLELSIWSLSTVPKGVGVEETGLQWHRKEAAGEKLHLEPRTQPTAHIRPLPERWFWLGMFSQQFSTVLVSFLSPRSVCVWVCVCLWVNRRTCVYRYTHSHVDACTWRSKGTWGVLKHSCLLFESGFLTGPELHWQRLHEGVSELLGATSHYFPSHHH